MARDINFYKELERLNYSLYPNSVIKINNWDFVCKHNDKQTGMYAEAHKNSNGEIVMVIKGTDVKDMRDLVSDAQLENSKIPNQSEPAFQFYRDLKEKYGNVIVSGYSLGASVAQIIGNETGAETVTFAAYGVGDIVKPNHTENIINFGNEADPVFQKNLDNQLGTIYVVPNTEGYDSDKTYSGELSDSVGNINKHMPGNMGDLSKAFEYTGRSYKLYASYDDYDDSIFDISNKVQYVEGKKLDEMSEEEIKQKVEQYFDNGDRLPKKDEMDRRVRFGELIYVENYTRSDGTKVTGYYRRYPNR